jgi:hypothetical protein
VKKAVVKNGLLKLVGRAAGLPMATALGAVGVRVTMGTQRLCARFNPASVQLDETGRFLARRAAVGGLFDCSDAALDPTRTAAPLRFPIAIGGCLLDDFVASRSCGDLPSLAFAPDAVAAACWTGLLEAPTSASALARLPAECCVQCGGQADAVALGDTITMAAGAVSTVLQALAGCLNADPPITDFLLPVVDCEPGEVLACNQSGAVVAFVPVQVTAVHAVGAQKGVDFDVVCADGTCGLGFCAPAATCETCALECGACP